MLALISMCSLLCAATPHFQVGRYEGTALNTTANARGTVNFEISAIDGRQVRAYFAASDGLAGESFLTGAIDDRGVLHVTGTLMQWKMVVDATSAGEEISAHYRLEGANPQAGEFQVRYAGPLPNGPVASVAELAGTWKKADAFTPPLNPITHLPMGDRFEDGGTLTIDRDGRYQLTHLHNHCDGFGAHCCRLDQTQSSGTVSVDHDALVFQIAQGKQLHHDSCFAKMNGLIPLQAHREQFRFELRRDPNRGTPGLCWLASGDWLCFWKT